MSAEGDTETSSSSASSSSDGIPKHLSIDERGHVVSVSRCHTKAHKGRDPSYFEPSKFTVRTTVPYKRLWDGREGGVGVWGGWVGWVEVRRRVGFF